MSQTIQSAVQKCGGNTARTVHDTLVVNSLIEGPNQPIEHLKYVDYIRMDQELCTTEPAATVSVWVVADAAWVPTLRRKSSEVASVNWE